MHLNTFKTKYFLRYFVVQCNEMVEAPKNFNTVNPRYDRPEYNGYNLAVNNY
jgi:hypothetical protein